MPCGSPGRAARETGATAADRGDAGVAAVCGVAADQRRMFAGIAGRYDRLNRLLSLGLDRSWRRRAVRALALGPGARCLDVGTGTADLLLEILREAPAARHVGVDLSLPMLLEGRRKLSREAPARPPSLVGGDGLRLPFRGASFDAVCAAFVLRNIGDRPRLFAEVLRVLRPGAPAALLELSRPRAPLLRLGHGAYLRLVVPAAGALLSTGPAYRYLAESIRRFPPPETILAELGQAGFCCPSARPLSGGIVVLFTARRPG